ncbi:MAG: type III-B CRISPR module RAMP protein Cmr6 [Bifidobacteriaceae bacterium]|jgi:CRISPR-associated protein Cmr6|nr:type III-B CRISPR module RAMP protein Cmr6 [Bifidobacteriaceae bacterium]
MTLNNGLFFYKHYFEGLPPALGQRTPPDPTVGRLDLRPGSDLAKEQTSARNDLLVKQTYQDSSEDLPFTTPQYQWFQLETRYPGLLIGTGYPHDIPAAGAIKLGFYFDYTTGLPVIPGSTVKGALSQRFDKHPDYVAEVLGESLGQAEPGKQITAVKELAREIFTGHKCVFLDAWPVRPSQEQEQQGRLLGMDTITPHPHKERYEGLMEPNPVYQLKVIPGVVFAFRFFLPERIGGLTRDVLLGAFKRIITDLGIGAKTNVGFGVFDDPETPVTRLALLESSVA